MYIYKKAVVAALLVQVSFAVIGAGTPPPTISERRGNPFKSLRASF